MPRILIPLRPVLGGLQLLSRAKILSCRFRTLYITSLTELEYSGTWGHQEFDGPPSSGDTVPGPAEEHRYLCVSTLLRTHRGYIPSLITDGGGGGMREDPEEASSSSPTLLRVGETSAAGAARHDVPAIPREDPYVVAREDLYKFVDMVDDAPRHPGCPISRELDYGITDEWDGLVEAIEEIAPTTIEGCLIRNITDSILPLLIRRYHHAWFDGGSRPPETSSVDYGTKAAKGATDTDG
ncbi:hypothetical protein Tco_0760008 [Tanacetum coccineum]